MGAMAGCEGLWVAMVGYEELWAAMAGCGRTSLRITTAILGISILFKSALEGLSPHSVPSSERRV